VAWADPRILNEIIRFSRGRYGDPRVRRQFQRFATSIGIVESGGRNVRHGDADSLNFRQERQSVYGDEWARSGGPYNTRAIVKRLANEFDQFRDPGETAGQIAAQVQRPAAQYAGRYAQVMPEARRLLQAARGGVRGGASGGTGGPSAAPGGGIVIPGSGGRRTLGESGVDVAGLLAALQDTKTPVQSVGLQAPAFSAMAAMPQGGQVPVSSGGPAPKQDIGALLAAVRTSGDPGLGGGGGTGLQVIPGQGGAKGAPAPRGRVPQSQIVELFWNGPGAQNIDNGRRVGKGYVSGHTDHVHAGFKTGGQARRAARLAQSLGLSVREYSPLDKVDPVHTEGSLHYQYGGKRAMDVSGDPAAMRKFARLIARGRY
jgi:hypothetical protein